MALIGNEFNVNEASVVLFFVASLITTLIIWDYLINFLVKTKMKIKV